MLPSNNTLRRTPNRSQEIQEHIQALAGRDQQLLSMALLLLLSLAGGVLALTLPSLVSSPTGAHSGWSIHLQLFLGLTALVVLFNTYVLLQKRELSKTRSRLLEELISNERMEAVSLVDAVTQLYNRRAMEQMLSHEAARTNRLGVALSLMILDIADFESISNRLGTQESERFLYEAAQLVKNTFRGSDMVFRYKEAQFLVVMPDTSESQVDFALRRLEIEIDRFNAELRSNAELGFQYGIAQFAHGSRITDVLQNVERKTFLRKHDFEQSSPEHGAGGYRTDVSLEHGESIAT